MENTRTLGVSIIYVSGLVEEELVSYPQTATKKNIMSITLCQALERKIK
jgi:hypothetical protein